MKIIGKIILWIIGIASFILNVFQFARIGQLTEELKKEKESNTKEYVKEYFDLVKQFMNKSWSHN